MEQAPTPGFNAAAFKAKLMERIAQTTPKTLEEADDFKNNNKLNSVKDEMQGSVDEEKAASQGDLEEKAKETPNTSGIKPKPVTPLPPAEIGETPNSIGAEKAVPKSKGNSEVEAPLQENSQKLDQQMAEADVTPEQLEKSNEPEFKTALSAKQDAQTHAQESPASYRQFEQEQLSQAEGEATTNAQEKLQGMHGERAGILGQVVSRQTDAKGKDEQARSKVAGELQKIYTQSKTKVESILSELDGKVNSTFDTGAADAQKAFENYVDERMKAYKDERYSGVIGKGRWLKDKFLGLPDEVNVFYEKGRQIYLDKMNVVLDEIVTIIGTELTKAKTEVAKGRQQVQDYVAKLPEDLKQVGQEAATNIQSQFDQLEETVDSKQEELIDSLAQKYNEKLQAVDAKIDEMKAANQGLVDKAANAITGVINTIKKLKDMLLNVLGKAASVIGSIIKDPIGFLGNLIGGIKQGFDGFVGNIMTHLQGGLIGWLTGALGPMGIQLPDDIFSLKGIFSLVMQVLGLTWTYIRNKAVKLFTEPIVAGMEKSVELFQVIRDVGPMGLWEQVKEQFGDLKETIIEQIKSMVITQVITAGVKWILGLLGIGGLAKKVQKIVGKIRKRIDQAIDKVLLKTKSLFKDKKGKKGKRNQDHKGKENKSQSEKKHGEIAKAAAQKLSVKPSDPLPYEKIREVKQKQAIKLEKQYNKQLDQPVKMTITFKPPEEDNKDGDMDFHIRIAPNNHDLDGSVENVTENSDNPRALLEAVNCDWKAAQKRYLTDKETWNKILKFREQEVNRIIAQVKKELKIEFNPIIAGSKDPTSDYDVTFDAGENREIEVEAVKKFNELFRDSWSNKEAGIVFDTNVCTTGHMPAGMGNLQISELKALEDELKNAPPGKKKQLISKIAKKKREIRSKARERQKKDRSQTQQQLAKESTKTSVAIQDVMSILKIRRFMSDQEWDDYTTQLLARFTSPKDKATKAETERRLQKADAIYKQAKMKLDARILALANEVETVGKGFNRRIKDHKQRRNQYRQRVQEIKKSEPNAEMAANNRLYEDYLDQVKQTLDEIKTLKSNDSLNDQQKHKLDRLTLKLQHAHSMALVFANEAYHTGGAVEDVVLNQQLNLKLPLKTSQYLESINENAGFFVEQIKHNHDEGTALWKSSKYLERICLATRKVKIKHFVQPPQNSRLLEMSRTLLDIKKERGIYKDKYNNAENNKLQLKSQDAKEVAAQYGYSSKGQLQQVVLDLSQKVNQQIRSQMKRQYGSTRRKSN